ncbi:TniQ family protein [Mesorhizobium sp. RIZ17]|uniref:TniQ family protein n=1 Tax=Mesorhizobium sp. RIZ17 TaxID=3132743 RepID=UPI003DA860B0
MAPLPLTVPLGDGETAASFASRLAGRNGAANVVEFCYDMGFDFAAVLRGDADAVSRLASLGGVSAEALQAFAFRKEGSRIILGGEVLLKSCLVRQRIRICPKCLIEDIERSPHLPPDIAVHGRAIWCVRPVYTCFRHHCRLVEIAKPERGEYAHDFSAIFFRRDLTVRQLANNAADQCPTPFENYVGERVSGVGGSPWLDQWPLFAVIRAADMFGVTAMQGPRFLVPEDEEGKRIAGQTGFEILAAGPARISRFLVESHSRFHRAADRLNGPKTSFGYFWDWANVDLRDDGYSRLRALFTDFLIDTFPYGPGDELFGQPVDRRSLHSVATAAKECGMHRKTLRKMLREAGVLNEEEARLPASLALFRAHEAEAILRDGPTALSLEDIAREYNCPRPHNYMLYHEGYLKPLFKRQGHGNGLGLHFSRSQLEAFMAALLKKSKRIGAPRPDQVGILEAARRANCAVREIVDLILEGRLAWIGQDGRTSGFKAILVDLEEVCEMTRGPDLPGMTKEQVEEALHVNDRTLKAIIASGLLPTETARNPRKRHLQEVIRLEALDAFRRDYVTLANLAVERRMHFRRLMIELHNAGVQPVLRREVHGATVYRRSQIPPAS